MSYYAAGTTISEQQSRAEIEALLLKHGASDFGYGHGSGIRAFTFRLDDRLIRVTVPIPSITDRAVTETPAGYLRKQTLAQKHARRDQLTKERLRLLGLVIKARLEAVAAGVTTVEQAFMAEIVLDDGRTVGDVVGPQIEVSSHRGSILLALPAPREASR